MNARYPSVCPRCNADIDVGEPIQWAPGTKATHYNCSKRGPFKKLSDYALKPEPPVALNADPATLSDADLSRLLRRLNVEIQNLRASANAAHHRRDYYGRRVAGERERGLVERLHTVRAVAWPRGVGG